MVSQRRKGPKPQANGEFLSQRIMLPVTATEKTRIEGAAQLEGISAAALIRRALRQLLEGVQ